MKSKLLFLCLIFSVLNSFSQKKYKKGYFTTINNKKVECYILENNINTIPEKFYYKASLNTQKSTIQTKSIQELFISPNTKYERHIVEIDDSSSISSELSTTRLSQFTKKSLLLKVLLAGNHTLLQYQTSEIKRFFVQNTDTIFPLEYKLYRTKNNQVMKNLVYQKQLKEYFNCKKKPVRTTIDYNSSSLVKYFITYNSCQGGKVTNYTYRNKGVLNLKGKFSMGSFSNQNTLKYGTNTKTTSSSPTVYKLGIEIEYILPFNNNKWALFVEPTYHLNSLKDISYDTGETVEVPSSGVITPIYKSIAIDYSAIEFPFGIRHHLYLSNRSAILLNTGILIDIPLNSKVFTEEDENGIDIKSSLSSFIGIGYSFNKKYSLELRHNIQKNRKSNSDLNLLYNNNTFIKLGYKFL